MAYSILGTRVDAVDYDGATGMIGSWAQRHESRYVCVAAVHIVMEGYDDPGLRTLVNAADLVVPDGMPLVWTLRRLGSVNQERVYGPELTLRLLYAAEAKGIPVGFVGSAPETLDLLVKNVRSFLGSKSLMPSAHLSGILRPKRMSRSSARSITRAPASCSSVWVARNRKNGWRLMPGECNR